VVKGGNGSLAPYLRHTGPFIACAGPADYGLIVSQMGLNYATSGAPGRERQFVLDGRGFLCVLLGSQALRWCWRS
jgi:hypothetical protein